MEVKRKSARKEDFLAAFGNLLFREKSDYEKLCDDGSKFYE